MRFALASAILAIGAATSALAEDIQVALEPGAFDPTNVTAQAGDTITFVFTSSNHSVTQSNFTDPCLPLVGGIDSGFEPDADNTTLTFTITINDTSPLWFHCAQTGHCQTGQVFAVNPTDNETFTEFQANANASSADGTPSNSTSKSTSPSSTTSGRPSSTTSSTASKSSSSSSATSLGARVGGLLAAVGFVAGILV